MAQPELSDSACFAAPAKAPGKHRVSSPTIHHAAGSVHGLHAGPQSSKGPHDDSILHVLSTVLESQVSPERHSFP